jgi:hypothetical protein
VSDPLEISKETQRKNMVLGWALFAFALLLAAGTTIVAFAYLWLD